MNRLARSSRLEAAAIITAKRCGDSQILSGQKLSAITEKGIQIQVIELIRKKSSIGQEQLAREASTCERTYRRIVADPDRASDAVIVRLSDALRRIRAGERLDSAQLTTVIAAAYGGYLAALAPRFGVTASQVRATNPRAGTTADRHWLTCAHVRQAAIYLVHTTLGIGQRAIARTVGLTEAAICLTCQAVERRRDDVVFARLLDEAAKDVTGRLA